MSYSNGLMGNLLERRMSYSNGLKGDQEETIDDLSYERVSVTANYLLDRTEHRPKIGIICGSGLASLADLLDNCDIFPYGEVPNFPQSTVPGHKSRLLFGKLNGVTVMLMQGRFHAYEGYPLGKVAMPVRVMKLCGVEALIATNAAGGLNPKYRVGDVMVLKDHINIPGFTGMHPLKGPNDQRFGGRFFAMNNCYDRRWRRLALDVAKQLDHEARVHMGVYAMLGGPNFETVAELKMLRVCGIDAVGMSTIPEVLVAHHCGINVFAFSLITNECVIEEESLDVPNHEEVILAANESKERLSKFVTEMVMGIDNDLANEANGVNETGAIDGINGKH
jgi:purine-nucleoside phosphorylase